MTAVYAVVGFIMVWGTLGSLLIVGLVSCVRFWRSLTPGQQLFREAQVDLELRKARERLIAESVRQTKKRP